MATIQPTALFTLSYGLFMLSARDESGRANGCIVNTVGQLTDKPLRITVNVNRNNLTEQIIRQTGRFNVSVLTEQTSFDTFTHFGFQSGRDADKFAGRNDPVAENGIPYLADANALFSARVVEATDFGSHTLFVAEVEEAQRLSDVPSATYAYYHAHIKPQKQPAKKKGYVCRICGYVHEGEELPPDFICPICKHGVADFEPLR